MFYGNKDLSVKYLDIIYIATKSSVVKLVGYSSNWHDFFGISKKNSPGLLRITLLMISSKSSVEQTAGKHIPSEIPSMNNIFVPTFKLFNWKFYFKISKFQFKTGNKC